MLNIEELQKNSRNNCQIIIAATMLLLGLFLFSCSERKQDPINQLEKLTEDIREHHNEYSTADWKEAYARYKQELPIHK